MTEAIFGLMGVFVGAFLQWAHAEWSTWKERERHARYLAIRVVCILDKYVENCAAVVLDDGLRDGQRDEEGCLAPQVDTPSALTFPDDLDWKSIDHELMYKLLSLPTKGEAADQMIGAASEHAFPPDYEEAFEERQYQYANLGLAALAISQEIRRKYRIPEQQFDEWNPADHLSEGRARVEVQRRKRREQLAKEANDLIGRA